MNTAVLYLISILHLAFIFFIVGVPLFVTWNCVLLLHAIIVPFMMAHWVANDNMCVLTVLEKRVRNQLYGHKYPVKNEDCFTCRLIEPIYDFDKNFDTFQQLIYAVTFCLWLGTLYRLFVNYKTGKLNSFIDLFNCD